MGLEHRTFGCLLVLYVWHVQFTKALVAKAPDCSLLRYQLKFSTKGVCVCACVCVRVCGGSEGSSEECVVRVVTAKGAA